MQFGDLLSDYYDKCDDNDDGDDDIVNEGRDKYSLQRRLESSICMEDSGRSLSKLWKVEGWEEPVMYHVETQNPRLQYNQ